MPICLVLMGLGNGYTSGLVLGASPGGNMEGEGIGETGGEVRVQSSFTTWMVRSFS